VSIKLENSFIPEVLKFVRDLIIEKGNPLGLSGKDCSKWAKELDIQRGGETIIYTSCMYQMMRYSEPLVEAISRFMGDPSSGLPIKISRFVSRLGLNPAKIVSSISRKRDYGEILRKGVSVLRELGIEFGYLYEEEPYSGALLYEYGFHDEFREHANNVYSILKEKGVKRVIVFDPHTADLLSSVYPEFIENFDIEVVTFVEIVKKGIEEGKISFNGSLDELFTYHDPCHFSKYMGLIDEPRIILRAINEKSLVEHPHSRELSVCCGGPIESLYPRLSKLMAKNRLEELAYTDAKKIIVACPICLANFERAKGMVDKDLEIVDIIEFVHDSMRRS